ncbi:MAG: thiamine pyrophosphate-dependent dehydrogenase E1 component subunit alpha [Bdellovibrionales bacterium]|jgi:pyruvate dehydrogenase E1 component alpha subunit|nr:thiamine pyrophosphate-dependent dehydrogenase E1 component subunit alpha [Bdellovibrionales bacterium]MBT3525028.1 thiamine pyrophosphate-dependent dehydrogenase E1 component subunit alpha [Bdellovibrionales bacterium]MBT7768173.1 thiamine pyrophosphate-dependent dehydrogenase E1 component subunit alpha [Bdellovibrionales bacterium]
MKLRALTVALLSRAADEWAVSLNRQGRMPTYAPNKGQEMNSIGALLALRDDDWFVPSFRELGGMLLRGLPLSKYYLYWLGNEQGSHLPLDQYHMLPVSVPIASQTLHAVGLSYADRYRNRDRVSIVFVGDGGTSEGDFYEALNFAAVWNTPTIFYIQNNGWAISTPRQVQTKVESLASKAGAVGMEGVQIDGNDLDTVYKTTLKAANKARNGGGPTLIEGITYRLGAHTTADDPTRYRTDEELVPWLLRDPLLRLKEQMVSEGSISKEQLSQMENQAKKSARRSFEEAESESPPKMGELYSHLYAEMPSPLEEQLQERVELRQRAAGTKGGAK